MSDKVVSNEGKLHIIQPSGPRHLTFMLNEFDNIFFKVGDKFILEISSKALLQWFSQWDSIVFKDGENRLVYQQSKEESRP